MKLASIVLSGLITAGTFTSAQGASVTLYNQNFEAPSGFVNGFGSGYDDLSQQTVNSLYGNQPTGFLFQQQATVETLHLTGDEAFDTGYTDATGQGGNYALGMQQLIENDRLYLTFDIGDFDFFNLQMDISNLGISGGIGAPFAIPTSSPEMRLRVFDGSDVGAFSLFDNPAFAFISRLLDENSLTGTPSDLDTLDWTTGTFAFDATGRTSNTVTLQLDLVTTGYVAFDNILITASDEKLGGIPTTPVSTVPLPGGLPLLLVGIGALGFMRSRRS